MCIWPPPCHVPKCLYLIKLWGFKFSTFFHVWVKSYPNERENVGFNYTFSNTEILILAFKG